MEPDTALVVGVGSLVHGLRIPRVLEPREGGEELAPVDTFVVRVDRERRRMYTAGDSSARYD